MIEDVEDEAIKNECLDLAKRISEVCGGHDMMLVSGALADVMSIWLAMMHPEAREEILTEWIKMVRKMIPVSEGQLEDGGHRPEEWPPIRGELN